MATSATPEKLQSEPIASDTAQRIASRAFSEIFRAYVEASDEVQAVIQDMCLIINDRTADPDDCEAALATLSEALFPVSHNGELGIDIEDGLRKIGLQESAEFKDEIGRFDERQRSFSARLKAVMEEQEISQTELAEKTGVQQPAISMILSRSCNPQRRTIEKLAGGLGVKPSDLCPGFEHRDETTES